MNALANAIERELGPEVDHRRPDFEAWVKKEMAQDNDHAAELLERMGHGYDDSQVDFAWDVWCACESSRHEPEGETRPS